MPLKPLLLGAVMACWVAAPAAAASVNGTLFFLMFGTVGGSPPSVTLTADLAQSVLAPSAFGVAPDGDFTGTVDAPFTTVAPFSVDFVSGTIPAFAFTSDVGSFTSGPLSLQFVPDLVFALGSGLFTPGPALAPGLLPTAMVVNLLLGPAAPDQCQSPDGCFALAGVIEPLTAVPVPMSLALFGLGLAGLGLARRRG